MFFWVLMIFLLVSEILLLSILLLPLPVILTKAVIIGIDRIKKPLWVIFAVVSAVLGNETMEMRAKQETVPDEVTSLNKEIIHNRKWRAERNFYIVAYTWTLLAILLRCQHLAKHNLDLVRQNEELQSLRELNQKEGKLAAETKKSK